MAQALYRKYRSQTFEEVIGQEHVTVILRNALREGRISHAYLFSGPRGTGKTSTARILAKAVNCLNPDPEQRPDNTCPICVAINEGRLVDLVEMDAASHTSVDNIRELIERVNFAPTEARYKVYVIDEAHMLSNAAFNALLKTLEEPPAHVIFVLATTEPHKIPETVLSRCQRFDFRRIPASLIVEHLERILEQEGRDAEPAALEHIALAAEGCMRDAVSLLDQLLSYGNGTVTLEQVESVLGVVPAATLARFVDVVAERDAGHLLAELHGLVARGIELRQFTAQLVRYLRDVLLVRVGGREALSDLPPERLDTLEEQAKRFSPGHLMMAVRRLTQVAQDVRSGVEAQLALELALLEILAWQPQTKPEAVATATEPTPAKKSAAPTSPSPAPLEGPPAPVQGDEEALKRLRGQWKRVIHWFREHRRFKIQAALGGARPARVSGDTVDLVFKNKFSLDMVQQPENLRLVETLISQILGKRYRVFCALEKEYEMGMARSETSTSGEPNQQSRMSEVLRDELVQEAVKQGGRIADIR